MLPIMAPLAQFLATEGIEGIRLQTYDDKTGDRLDEGETPVGKASIAVGLIKYSDGTPVKPGDELTLQEAWDETYHYLNKVLTPALSRLITVNLPDHKLMAFSSWLYNFGETKARGYSLPKLINSGADDRVIIEKWLEYINAGGRPQLGLYRRRMAEVLMWLDYDWRPALNANWETSIFDLIEASGGEVPPALVDDVLFDEDEVTADLNRAQLESLKTGKKPAIPKGPAPAPPQKPIALEEVKYGIHDPKDVGFKPMTKTKRYQGRRDVDIGKVLAAGAVGTGSASAIAGNVEDINQAFTSLSPVALLIFFVCTALIVGIILIWHGKNKEYRGREEASQPMV